LHKGKEGVTFTEFFDNPTKDPDLVHLKRWLQNPTEVKPGSLMPALGITDDEADILADFLENLK
jgi:cytochrome c1